MESLTERVKESEEITEDVALEIASTSQFSVGAIMNFASIGARYHRETRTIVSLENENPNI